jgi:hypothetical protein
MAILIGISGVVLPVLSVVLLKTAIPALGHGAWAFWVIPFSSRSPFHRGDDGDLDTDITPSSGDTTFPSPAD